jgi:hypothetical protein
MLAAIGAGAIVLTGVSSAGASTTIGQTFVVTGDDTCPGAPDWEFLQTGRSAGPSYAAPSDGVITSWSFMAGDAETVLTMRVFRPTGTADEYTVVADGSELKTIAPSSGLHTFPTQLSVKAGDIVGIRSTSGGCAVNTNDPADTFAYRIGTALAVGGTAPFSTGFGFIVDISAELERDADGDGFGDESQDQCASRPGPGPCLVTPPATEISPPATCRGSEATIVGTTGPDRLKGTPGHDLIQARGGNDLVKGLGGDDTICGAKGNDKLMGGTGADTLIGGAHSDLLLGGKHVDSHFGGTPGATGSGTADDRCPNSEEDQRRGCRGR